MKLFWKLDLIGVATALALPAAAYWTQVSPAMQRNVAAASAIQQLDQQHATQAELQRTLTMLLATSKTNSTTEPSLALQPLSNLNRRLAELNDLAAKHNLQIDTLDAAPPEHRDRYSLTTISLAATGDYRSCQEWMTNLHASLADVSIATWQLASVTTDKNPQLRLNVTLRWFALPKTGSR